MKVRDSLRAMADALRGTIPQAYGLRTWRVDVVTRTWLEQQRPGDGGTSSVSGYALTCGAAQGNPKVRELSSRDIVASGGFYQTGDYEVGPLTPSPGGSITGDLLDPAPNQNYHREVYYFIQPDAQDGPGFWCEKVSTDDGAKNFRRMLVLRRLSREVDIVWPSP